MNFENSDFYIWRSLLRAVENRSVPDVLYWVAQLVIHTPRLTVEKELPTIE